MNATSHRSTPYPCCVSTLGGFRRSWSCDAHRSAKVRCVFEMCKFFWDAFDAVVTFDAMDARFSDARFSDAVVAIDAVDTIDTMDTRFSDAIDFTWCFRVVFQLIVGSYSV